ncbi:MULTISPECIES: hypothetical protein [Aerococcus]|uniref:Uncharacterized protein n=2 Tax=Aerococcus TaxID=1375 RepID=A0A0X8FE53_9LACT|nr:MULTISPECIES: hypothetical protein [Aerococcus]AMB95565.1 hypothetical protein AWM73_03045 [Aerococcus urinae]MCY3032571.1 hypothetical protein [Aerococcus urinae]MCY3037872.1 hypothetical protein [Aerococcus urinae]MCY3044617.1 hypothetical protein [Aerococcus urinae]MCY3045754.1 hypothetical protein [Aerococcus urinae]
MDVLEIKDEYIKKRMKQLLNRPQGDGAYMLAEQEFNLIMTMQGIIYYIEGDITKDQLELINDQNGIDKQGYELMREVGIIEF